MTEKHVLLILIYFEYHIQLSQYIFSVFMTSEQLQSRVKFWGPPFFLVPKTNVVFPHIRKTHHLSFHVAGWYSTPRERQGQRRKLSRDTVDDPVAFSVD